VVVSDALEEVASRPIGVGGLEVRTRFDCARWTEARPVSCSVRLRVNWEMEIAHALL
jgi:hypothetical protein